MANDFYQHSGHPGTRAPRSSALLRAEFAAIEDGFDKLPDVGTANLFSVSNGSALVGKTAAQAKVILALENVTNTADADKPISTLTQAALDLKADAADVSEVDNTSDADKPISTLTQAALDLKAPLANPTLTGTVTIPTAETTSDTTVAASTAFVRNLIHTMFEGHVAPLSLGYQKFQDGIVIQWGEDATDATANTPKSTNYLLAFDSGPFALVATPNSNVSPVTTLFCSWNYLPTAFQQQAAVSSLGFRWIAIGFITPA